MIDFVRHHHSSPVSRTLRCNAGLERILTSLPNLSASTFAWFRMASSSRRLILAGLCFALLVVSYGSAFTNPLERLPVPSPKFSPKTNNFAMFPHKRSKMDTALQAIPGVGPAVQTIGSLLSKFFASIVREKIVLSHLVIAFIVGMYFGKGRLPFAPYKQVSDIPNSLFGPKARPLSGHAVRVSDGDTIRFLHAPTPFHKKELGKKQKSSTNALAVRICTIDTPETKKFGKSGTLLVTGQ